MISNSYSKRQVFGAVSIAILYIAVFWILAVHFDVLKDMHRAPAGRIAFLWSPDRSSTMRLVMSDGNGDAPRYMTYASGTLAFSPDGSLLATGCRPDDGMVSEICILDVKKISAVREKIAVNVYDSRYPIKSKIALPEQCLKYQYKPGELLEGIYSIDWSPKADRLILVCGETKNREVCIVSLEGDSHCWDKNVSKDVSHAVWSPSDENAILIYDMSQGFTSKIYLVDPSGKTRKYITDGLSPAWSPDGKQIAYVEPIHTKRGWNDGIASINIDGANHRWLYVPKSERDIFTSIDLIGSASGRPTRLAWSPDGRYIVFSAVQGSWTSLRIFRLDISTGKVIILMDHGIFGNTVTEPDWGSWPE
jgi:dipeptidyl aminopeptidase/acylaminoacyl peptidase